MAGTIKIAFDASPLLVNKTGVAYYIEQLVTELAKQYPNQVELIGFYYNFVGRKSASHFPVLPNIRYKPVKFIPSKVVYQLRRWNIEIPVEIFLKEKVDFILYGNFLGYPSLRHTPSATVVHDLTFLDLPEYVSSKNRSDLERFVPKEINRSKFVITVSEFSKHKISNNYSLAENSILVTPIPPQMTIKHSAKDCAVRLAELQINKPFILFLGTIEPRKNIISLIDAYEALPKQSRENTTLVIAGRIGWNCNKEIARLEKAKADGLDIKHIGYIDDQTKNILYQSAMIFCTASHYEGFGMPVLEAMSYKVPCAVSDIQVFHEVAGDAGVYFNPKNIQSIQKALNKLIIDDKLRTRLSELGQKRANSFRWSDVATSLYAKIRSVVK